mmetsp:Transcript_51805/g.83590  ORF Transcript_51805/g.83590 Transcript_51805/m.83590 type:complete len:115 (-) Transcript_51805:62-406(-)
MLYCTQFQGLLGFLRRAPESGLEGDRCTRDATIHDDFGVELAAGGLGGADGLVGGDERRQGVAGVLHEELARCDLEKHPVPSKVKVHMLSSKEKAMASLPLPAHDNVCRERKPP